MKNIRFQKLQKLKDYKIDSIIIKKIDELLYSLEKRERKRILPKYFERKLDLNKQETINLLSYCVAIGILTPRYKVTCHECDSDVKIINNIPQTKIDCKICECHFIPSLDDIWVTFELVGD